MSRLTMQACTISLFGMLVSPGNSTPIPAGEIASPTPQVMAQDVFVVTIPEPLQANETLAIAIMDEVTADFH